jgi:ribosomal protein S18 acetylase RimI-like enzyme
MTTSLVRTRQGTDDDLALVTALHDRCSADALLRRFHAPVPRVPDRMARGLIAPHHGWSVLAVHGQDAVGMACAGPVSEHMVEVGILVEDASQGRGVGSRLLRDVATEGAARGYRSLLCLTQPDNDAVLATIQRVALPHTVTYADGLMRIVMQITSAEAALPLPA